MYDRLLLLQLCSKQIRVVSIHTSILHKPKCKVTKKLNEKKQKKNVLLCEFFHFHSHSHSFSLFRFSLIFFFFLTDDGVGRFFVFFLFLWRLTWWENCLFFIQKKKNPPTLVESHAKRLQGGSSASMKLCLSVCLSKINTH